MPCPSKYKIVEYWTSEPAKIRWPKSSLLDRDHAACFACKYQVKNWERNGPGRPTWENAYLERAHIVASSSEGCNEPSNLVLLCIDCHISAPMTNVERHMFDWIDRRQSYIWSQFKDVCNAFTEIGLDITDPTVFNGKWIGFLPSAYKELSAGMHWYSRTGTHLTSSTKALLAQRAIQLFNEASEEERETAMSSFIQRLDFVL